MVKRIGWMMLAVLLVFSFLWVTGHTPVQAKDEDVIQTLEKILKNQEKMMADLDFIKQELNRIRVRTN